MVKKVMLTYLNNRIRKNPLLTQCLFNVKLRHDTRIHWDFTTIILKKALKKYVTSSHTVLEIGTGPFALLPIWLFRMCRCEIHACDINEEYVKSAREYIKKNNVSISIFQSDLFSNSTGIYDIIFFNSVYIPVEHGKANGIDTLHEYQTDWCGGRDGLETITRFLNKSKRHLSPAGKLLLGFNIIYLKEIALRQLCNRIGYTISDVCSFPFYPSKVYILEL